MRTCLVVVPITILLSACGAEEPTQAPPISRGQAVRADSGVVEIVSNAAPWWAEGETVVVAPEPDLIIGSPEGARGDDFGYVRDLAVLSDGRIVVGDDRVRALRVFDRDGQPLDVIGRDGEGPGEFGGIRMVERFAGDSLMVFDWSNARLTWYSPQLELARTEPVRTRVSGIAMPHVKAVTHSGVPIMTGARPPWVEEPVEFYGQPQHVLVRDGGDDFDREIALSPGKGFLDVYYATAGEQVLVVHGGDFQVRGYDLDGGLRRLTRRDYEAPAIPPEFFDERADAFGNTTPATLTPQGGGMAIRTELRDRDPADYPERLAAVDAFLVGRDGRMWLRHGIWPEEGDRTWSVFRPDGQWLGEVTTPEGLQVLDITESHIYGVRRDDFDVQYVVRYPLLGGR